MLKMIWFFSLVLVGTAWSDVPMEEINDSETGALPSLEMIESILRSSFEKVSRNNLFGGVSNRAAFKANKPQMSIEPMSFLHHGIHAASDESMKLACVWEAMCKARAHLRNVVPSSMSFNTLRERHDMSGLCQSLANTNCDADYKTLCCNSSYEYRSMNGTCNNLQNPTWGAAPQPFERYLQADYGDGVMSFRTGRNGRKLPNPRKISRILSNSVQRKKPKISLLVMQWGQFIDHDVTFTPERERHEPVDGSKALMCCDHGQYNMSENLGTDCVPIDVEGDSYYTMDNRCCIRFIRSLPATTGCSFTPMEQINQITAFVDGSQVYGSTEEVSNYVRAFRRGRLNVTLHEGNDQPLPPRGGNGHIHGCPFPESMGECYLAGDARVDEMPGLTAMHTTFIRLHNIIAAGLLQINPHWRRNDEKIFQEARRIVSALIQQITYRDWLPHVLGPTLMKELNLGTGSTGYRDTYNPNINPTIRNVFATAAFRFGHTLLTDFVKAATEETTLPLEGHFFNISVVQSNGTAPSSLLKGLARCPSSPIDGFVVNTFTDKLFARPNSDGRFFGLDLVSLNIQRGRDHGIPSYTKWRQFCGLKSIKKLRQVMERDLAKELECAYAGIHDVDLFPAGLSEFPMEDGLLGPTFSCILGRQFAQIKHGDRFWYERENQPKPFTPAQLSSIRSQNLATIMCKVSDHTKFQFQPDPFLVDCHPGNQVRNCSTYNFINLLPWKETPPNSEVEV